MISSEDKGRGVAADEDITKGEFVVEYKYSESYSIKEKDKWEKEYIQNEEGCYVLEVQLPDSLGWYCLDATRNPNSWGRYINHAAKPNLKMHRPVKVRDRWRVGFLALCDIKKGEELTYDYGRQKNAPDWLQIRQLSQSKGSHSQSKGSHSRGTYFQLQSTYSPLSTHVHRW